MSENGQGGPCFHLGQPLELRRVRTPLSAKIVAVRSCTVYGQCSETDPVSGLACCHPAGGAPCDRFTGNPFRLVAPLGTQELARRAEGRCRIKPWEYRTTVMIPHLNTLPLLEAVVALHRLQTERPYIVIVDTGSPPSVMVQMENLRAEDLEIHYVRCNGYRHSSAPVTTAMDVAFAVCKTKYLFCTHSDVFPRRRDLVEWMRSQCDENAPAVGWEMSPRVGIDMWRGVLSHTCTMLYMPIMRAIGATWSLERWWDANPESPPTRNGWPDTETGIDQVFQEWGVKKVILGGETNFERQQTEWWDHARSITGLRVHAQGSALLAAAEAYSVPALQEAIARAQQWKNQG
jgi:hypothetical protein